MKRHFYVCFSHFPDQAHLGNLTSVILVFSPNSVFRKSSRGSDSYGRDPLKTRSFILKYRQRKYSMDFPAHRTNPVVRLKTCLKAASKSIPWTMARARIPPVLVPATQSKSSLVGLPASFSRAISIWIRTSPLIPPPSRHSSRSNLRTHGRKHWKHCKCMLKCVHCGKKIKNKLQYV